MYCKTCSFLKNSPWELWLLWLIISPHLFHTVELKTIIISVLPRCRCLYVVPAVFQGPGRLSVVGSLSAALTVYHVTMAKLAIRQVSLNPATQITTIQI